jgi:hypothetical protein
MRPSSAREKRSSARAPRAHSGTAVPAPVCRSRLTRCWWPPQVRGSACRVPSEFHLAADALNGPEFRLPLRRWCPPPRPRLAPRGVYCRAVVPLPPLLLAFHRPGARLLPWCPARPLRLGVFTSPRFGYRCAGGAVHGPKVCATPWWPPSARGSAAALLSSSTGPKFGCCALVATMPRVAPSRVCCRTLGGSTAPWCAVLMGSTGPSLALWRVPPLRTLAESTGLRA